MIRSVPVEIEKIKEVYLSSALKNYSFQEKMFSSLQGQPLLFNESGYMVEPNTYLLRTALETASVATRKARASHIRAVLDFFDQNEWDWKIASSNLAYIRRYQASVRGENPKISKTSWNQRMVHFWLFVQDLSEKNIISVPNYSVDVLKESGKEESDQRGLSPSEFRKFLDELQSDRDKAMAQLLRSTGMRISEAHHILIDEVPNPQEIAKNFNAGIRSIIGKGRKKREIFWSEETAKLVHRYINQERALSVDVSKAKSKSKNVLWINNQGEPLSVKFWDKAFSEASKKSCVKCTPHTLRHTFAVSTLAHLIAEEAKQAMKIASGDKTVLDDSNYYLGALEELRRLMGHAFISTTQGYLRYVPGIQTLLSNALKESNKTYGSEV